MIDYDLTLKKFFDSVGAYLDKCAQTPFDETDKDNIQTARIKLGAVAKNPRAYANYFERNGILTNQMMGLIRYGKGNYVNNDAYLAFFRVLAALEKYYFAPDMAYNQKALMVAIKTWYLVTADSGLKNFWYSVVPLEYFAVKTK